MFKIIKVIIKCLLSLLLVIVSPIIFIISVAHVNSFKEAMENTLEMVSMPFDDFDWNRYLNEENDKMYDINLYFAETCGYVQLDERNFSIFRDALADDSSDWHSVHCLDSETDVYMDISKLQYFTVKKVAN